VFNSYIVLVWSLQPASTQASGSAGLVTYELVLNPAARGHSSEELQLAQLNQRISNLENVVGATTEVSQNQNAQKELFFWGGGNSINSYLFVLVFVCAASYPEPSSNGGGFNEANPNDGYVISGPAECSIANPWGNH
jgi:hypothetical protein